MTFVCLVISPVLIFKCAFIATAQNRENGQIYESTSSSTPVSVKAKASSFLEPKHVPL